MAKGAIGKQEVIKKIQEAFGADFIGEYDKKVYVWTQENGERIQIAMALTCPKVPVAADNTVLLDSNPSGDLDFENMGATTVAAPTPVVITADERKNVEELMARLGL